MQMWKGIFMLNVIILYVNLDEIQQKCCFILYMYKGKLKKNKEKKKKIILI